MREGHILLLSVHPFSPQGGYSAAHEQNPGTTPLELLALLALFGLPSLFTFWKLSELLGFGERSHQLSDVQDMPQKTNKEYHTPLTGISQSLRRKKLLLDRSLFAVSR